MGQLRQDLMGGLTETVIDHTHASEIEQTQAACPSCEGSLSVRRQARRTVDNGSRTALKYLNLNELHFELS